jgi:hypothetical protein
MKHSTTELISRYRKSGLTQHKFCDEFKIPHSTLQYHLHKSKAAKHKSSSVSGFLSFPAPPQTLTNATIIVVHGSFTVDQIAEIIGIGGKR